MRDLRGEEIKVGSQVVYPTQRGHRLSMNWAFVLEVRKTSLTVQGVGCGNPKVVIRRVDNVVVVPAR